MLRFIGKKLLEVFEKLSEVRLNVDFLHLSLVSYRVLLDFMLYVDVAEGHNHQVVYFRDNAESDEIFHNVVDG